MKGCISSLLYYGCRKRRRLNIAINIGLTPIDRDRLPIDI